MPGELSEKVERLVHSDVDAAVVVARRISAAGPRSRALSWAARFHSSDAQARQLARQAEKAAGQCADAFGRMCTLAWVVAALAERGDTSAAERVLDRALELANVVEPASSRAEGLFLLMQASVGLGEPVMRSLGGQVRGHVGQDGHWRCRRAVRDMERLLAGEVAARPFFW